MKKKRQIAMLLQQQRYDLNKQQIAMTNIVCDMETCMRVLDDYARRVMGRFADIPMNEWDKHIQYKAYEIVPASKQRGSAISAKQNGAARQRKRAKRTSEPAGSFGAQDPPGGPRDRDP